MLEAEIEAELKALEYESDQDIDV